MSVTDIETPDEQTEQQQDSRHFAKVKQQLADAEAKAERYRKAAIDNAARIAGYDPTDFVTRQLVKEFETARPDDDPTPEALLAYAQEVGAPEPKTAPPAEPAQPDIAQLVTRQQAVGDGIREASTPATPADIDEQIVEAERNGDTARSIALKNEKFGLGRPAGATP